MTGWVIGYVIGVAIVVIVVALATILILQARKIAAQAADILVALDESREHTNGLWEVDKVNRSLESIRESAKAARHVATGGGT